MERGKSLSFITLPNVHKEIKIYSLCSVSTCFMFSFLSSAHLPGFIAPPGVSVEVGDACVDLSVPELEEGPFVISGLF